MILIWKKSDFASLFTKFGMGDGMFNGLLVVDFTCIVAWLKVQIDIAQDKLSSYFKNKEKKRKIGEWRIMSRSRIRIWQTLCDYEQTCKCKWPKVLIFEDSCNSFRSDILESLLSLPLDLRQYFWSLWKPEKNYEKKIRSSDPFQYSGESYDSFIL